MNRSLASVLAAVSFLVFCGCVHQEVGRDAAPKSETTLTVTRSGESVQLTWISEVGKMYDVLYTEKLGGRGEWKVLPGAGNIRGTGESVTVMDSVVTGANRYYRLNISLQSQREDSRGR